MADPNPSHGALFDQFSRRASHAHGGSLFDSNFAIQTITDAHGRLYDLFGAPKDSDQHGGRFDDFGWRDMPAVHGQHFDSEFRDPAAGEDHGYSTWFDVFRGGNVQGRLIVDGKDLEGVVVDCNHDFATVRDHTGQCHEVELSQFLAYRTPNDQQAGPAIPASDADAPSAHSADAHGGHHTGAAGEPVFDPSNLPTNVAEAPQGQYTEPRTAPPSLDELTATVQSLKSLADDGDVAKEHLGWNKMVSRLEAEGHSKEHAAAIAGYIAKKKYGPGMNRGKSLDAGLDVLKSVTAEDAMKVVCPTCGSDRIEDHFKPGDGVATHVRCANCGQAGWLPGTGRGHSLAPAFEIAANKTVEDLDVAKAIPFGVEHRVLPENVSGIEKGTPVQFKHGDAHGAGIVEKPNVKPGFHRVDVHHSWSPSSGFGAIRGGAHDIPHGAITHAQTMHAVGKSVDATETATQRESGVTVKTVGHRSNCPRGGSAPCGVATDGHCTLCGAEVHDHEAVGKAFGTAADPFPGGGTVTIEPGMDRTGPESGQARSDPPTPDVKYREHKTSDHHMRLGAKPGRCPHCGAVLELLDEQTEQGSPSRKDKQGAGAEFSTVTAHKCVGTGLDVLKSMVSA